MSCTIHALAQTPTSNRNSQWQLDLRYQTETSPSSGRYHTLVRHEAWDTAKTAIIVCDVWDSHHSRTAVLRVQELAPRLNQVLMTARDQGVTIIHAPSECMDAYTNHPARLRAQAIPKLAALPKGIQEWCKIIDSEKSVEYPIDQSDGGDDDDAASHEVWLKELEKQGRNPKTPWKAESPLITIDANRDYISDRGEEIWSLLEARGITNVVITGVHTNMCILGRPFGLRNMVTNGKRTVLLRDLTDTMYNPRMRPFVNHHTGTDLIVEHIERVVCPTISSEQIIGGKPFRFQSDRRPTVAILMAEDEYETNQTLPKFARTELGQDFRVRLIYSADDKPNHVPGIDALAEADALIVSVRRRPLPPTELAFVRKFEAAGKPIIGIRTASHSFVLRDGTVPAGLEAWPEFDNHVLGGSYTNHHDNALLPTISIANNASEHSLLRGVKSDGFRAGGSLYRTSPLGSGAQPLLMGSVEGKMPEPVAWTFRRANGGRTFYTSLGHKDDFNNVAFVQLLKNALYWATDVENK